MSPEEITAKINQTSHPVFIVLSVSTTENTTVTYLNVRNAKVETLTAATRNQPEAIGELQAHGTIIGLATDYPPQHT